MQSLQYRGASEREIFGDYVVLALYKSSCVSLGDLVSLAQSLLDCPVLIAAVTLAFPESRLVRRRTPNTSPDHIRVMV